MPKRSNLYIPRIMTAGYPDSLKTAQFSISPMLFKELVRLVNPFFLCYNSGRNQEGS